MLPVSAALAPGLPLRALPSFRAATTVLLVVSIASASFAAPASQSFGLSTVAAIFSFALAMSITPGPNNLMIAASAANFGIRRTLPHAAGIVAGFPAMVIAVGLGPGALVAGSPPLHAALKVGGALYLLYLAWRLATARPSDGSSAGDAGSRPLSFWQAAIFQWVNPKGWVAVVGAVATYTTVGGSFAAEVAVIAAAFALTALPSLFAWALFGAAMARWLATPRRLRLFNWAMAALLVLSLLPLFV